METKKINKEIKKVGEEMIPLTLQKKHESIPVVIIKGEQCWSPQNIDDLLELMNDLEIINKSDIVITSEWATDVCNRIKALEEKK